MKTRAEIPEAETLGALAKSGWVLSAREDVTEWWAREIWELRSSWSPTDDVAYLVFLIDPQDDSKSPRIYAVRASHLKPTDRLDKPGEFTLYLGKGWSKKVPEFEDFLQQLHQPTALQPSNE